MGMKLLMNMMLINLDKSNILKLLIQQRKLMIDLNWELVMMNSLIKLLALPKVEWVLLVILFLMMPSRIHLNKIIQLKEKER